MGEILKPFGDYGTPGPQGGVIDLLRGLLQKAERGEIIGLSYGAVKANGGMSFGYKAGSANCGLLLAAARLADQQLAADLLEGSPDVEMPSAS